MLKQRPIDAGEASVLYTSIIEGAESLESEMARQGTVNMRVVSDLLRDVARFVTLPYEKPDA